MGRRSAHSSSRAQEVSAAGMGRASFRPIYCAHPRLAEGRTGKAGFHTVFANMHEGGCSWTLPIYDPRLSSPSRIS
jgi:hypothetical protein